MPSAVVTQVKGWGSAFHVRTHCWMSFSGASCRTRVKRLRVRSLAAVAVVRSGNRLVWTDDNAIAVDGAVCTELKAAGGRLIAATSSRGLRSDDLEMKEGRPGVAAAALASVVYSAVAGSAILGSVEGFSSVLAAPGTTCGLISKKMAIAPKVKIPPATRKAVV
jgi:hypothetical protein